MLKVNTIYNTDCLVGFKEVDDNSIDIIITSPPYNLGIKYDSYDDLLPWNEYLDWCKAWLSECFRVLKDDGRIFINHYLAFAPPTPEDGGQRVSRFPLFDIRNIMEEIGFGVHKLAIWNDSTVVKYSAYGSWLSASSPNIQLPYEGILIGYKKIWKKLTEGKTTCDKETFLEATSGVWNVGTTANYTIACFPEKLPYLCIQCFSYEGDLVLDPFSGSGTTCYVAKSLNRKFIGFELSKNYWLESLSRLNGAPYQVSKFKKQDDKVSLW